MPRGYLTSLLPSIGHQTLGGSLITQGNSWFVSPYYGSDSNNGKRPDRPFATLAQALSAATANQNDVVYLMATSNTAANTTDYQTATLDWNKDGVHLVGINAGGFLSQRSRVAFKSTYVTASNLFTLSANNCLIANVEFFAGVASANPTGCMAVTGSRNRLIQCHIAGIGNDLMDSAGAYSLYLNAAQENVFERCAIGLDTIARGSAANSEILVDGSAPRNKFLDCLVLSQLEHATNHPQVYLNSATAVEMWLLFKRCTFINISTNYGYTNTYVIGHQATPTKGYVVLDQCGAAGATNWANASKKVELIGTAKATGYTANISYDA